MVCPASMCGTIRVVYSLSLFQSPCPLVISDILRKSFPTILVPAAAVGPNGKDERIWACCASLVRVAVSNIQRERHQVSVLHFVTSYFILVDFIRLSRTILITAVQREWVQEKTDELPKTPVCPPHYTDPTPPTPSITFSVGLSIGNIKRYNMYRRSAQPISGYFFDISTSEASPPLPPGWSRATPEASYYAIWLHYS